MLICTNNGKIIPNLRLKPLSNKPTFKSVSEKNFNFPILTKKKQTILTTEDNNILNSNPIKKRLDSIELRVKEFRKKVKIVSRKRDIVYLAMLYIDKLK